MRTIFIAVTALILLPAALVEVDAQAPLRVVSFNIRYGTANDGDHVWPNRRQHVITTIRDHSPHLLGLQEVLAFQFKEIGAALPRYHAIGVGRDDGVEKGEYAAILVDTARFDIQKYGQFWFSDTPHVPGSKHWGNNITRLCTWVRVIDRATGDSISVFNVHWDHESQPSRMKSADLILSKIPSIAGNDAVILMGDFNAGLTNSAIRKLVSDTAVRLRETSQVIDPRASQEGTFHGFRGVTNGERIDAIFTSPGIEVVSFHTDTRKFGDLWPSDHFPVMALLRVLR